jgi:hypothetical protein
MSKNGKLMGKDLRKAVGIIDYESRVTVLLNEMCWLSIILTDKNYIDRELAKADEKEEIEVQKLELELIAAENKRIADGKKG